jgi:tRNA1Val (adenine37-N6)-methyltransferase
LGSDWFHFKQFSIFQGHSAMKVCTDACIFGGLVAHYYSSHKENQPSHCLDTGTGTGLLSLMLAQKLTQTSFLAIEPDQGSFRDAAFNFEKSPFYDRLKIEPCAYQDFGIRNSFPLIVCNPPFFAGHLKSPDSHRNKAMHLDKNDWIQWLYFFRDNLSENGLCWLLLSSDLGRETLYLLENAGLYCHFEMSLHQKKNKNWRKVLSLGRQKPAESIQIETHIFTENGHYQEEIRSWITDYYLHI